MSQRTGRLKRLVAAVAGAGIAASVAPVFLAQSASAATPPAAPSIEELCANAPDDPTRFNDIGSTSGEARLAILCLAFAEIVQGGPEGRPASQYGPTLLVSRAQMASFIARAGDKANELDTGTPGLNDIPATGPDAFVDDQNTPAGTNPHEANTNRLAEADIVQGGPEGLPANQYAPRRNVSRAQMSSFIWRLIDFLGCEAPTTTEDFFTDDTNSPVGTNPHEQNTNNLASVGIVQGGPQGTSPTLYGPSQNVSRAQMALFISRTLAYLLEQGCITAFPPGEGPIESPISISPSLLEPAFNFASADSDGDPSTDENDNGLHRYTIQVDPEEFPTLDLALVPANAINVDIAAGAVSFEDDNGDDRADLVDPTNPNFLPGSFFAAIEAVNGVRPVNPVSPNTPVTAYVNNQSTGDDGIIEVDVDSIFPADAVFLVAFQDLNNDNRLTLGADNIATEIVGVSGLKLWTNCESEFEADFSIDNVIVGGNPLALVMDFFTGSTGQPQASNVEGEECGGIFPGFGGIGTRFNYDDNDIFRIEGVQVTKEQFEAAISRGDDVDAAYNPDPAGVSEFNIFDDFGYDAPALDGIVTNVNGDDPGNDVVLDITTPGFNQPNAEYIVQRRSLAGGDNVCGTPDDAPGTFAEVETVTLDTFGGEDPGDTIRVTELDVPNGCYEYRVVVIDPNTNEERVSNSVLLNVPAPPDNTPPVLVQSIMSDNQNPNQLGPGDVVDLIFSEQVTPEAGDIIQITDQDGEFTNIVLGTGNTFTVTHRGGPAQSGQTQLQIVLDAAPTVAGDVDGDNSNNDNVLDFTFFPDVLFVDGATGIEDLAGNEFEPDGTDVILPDDDGPFITGSQSTEGEFFFDLFFSEALDPESANDPANYAVDNDGTFGDNTGTNPVVSVQMFNGAEQNSGGLIDAWTRVRVRVTFAITDDTVVSQTVEDKLGNSGDFNDQSNQAEPDGPHQLDPQGIIILNPGANAIDENGGSTTLDVSLARPVTNQDVFVFLQSQTPDVCDVDNPGPLVFSPDPPNTGGEDPQQVNIFAIDDQVDEQDEVCVIAASAVSSDPLFNGQTGVTFVDVIDNDDTGIEVDSLPNATEGSTDTFGVRLTSDPGDGNTVNVTVTSEDTTEYNVAPATLTFTGGPNGNFDEFQQVTVTPVDDNDDCEGAEVFDTELAVLGGSDSSYEGFSDTVSTTINDNDGCAFPSMTAARFVAGTNQIDIDVSEAVDCRATNVDVADNFTFNGTAISSQTGLTGAQIAQQDADTCRVTFNGGTWTDEDAGNVTYTGEGPSLCGAYPPAANCPSDVVETDSDPNQNGRLQDTTIAAGFSTAPTLALVEADASNNSVYFEFTEPIVCGSLDFSDVEVRVNGALVPINSLGTGADNCDGIEDNDQSVTVGFDILAGDTVNLRVIPGGVVDHQGQTNPDTNLTDTAA